MRTLFAAALLASTVATTAHAADKVLIAPVQASAAVDADLAVEAVLEVPPGGHFFGSSHTMTRFETAFHAPLVSDWTAFESWKERGAKETAERATEIWQRVLRDYEPPPLDAGVDEAMRDHIARRTREEGVG